jgi:magnesium chelatase subunit D
VRRIPLHVGDGRLLGGLDLAATLRAGRPVADRGLLAEADGGVLLLAMAERLPAATAAYLAAALDAGEVVLERDGLALRTLARVGAVALDEGLAEDERPPEALLDRLAFRVDLHGVSAREAAVAAAYGADAVAAARVRLPAVRAGEDVVEALCSVAATLGVASLRAPLLALRVAHAAAALAGRDEVSEADAALAGRLVLAPRATRLPATEQPEDDDAERAEQTQPEQAPSDDRGTSEDTPSDEERPLDDLVLAAAQAAIPASLLAQLQLAEGGRAPRASAGRVGALQRSTTRGRPAGTRQGEPRAGARLNLVETLRAAAPWQRLRRREAGRPQEASRVEVRRDDFRVGRFEQRSQSTTIFVVDASGRRRSTGWLRRRGRSSCCWRTATCAATGWRCWPSAGGVRSCCCRRPARWCGRSGAWPACPAAAAPRWPPGSTRRRRSPTRSGGGARRP